MTNKGWVTISTLQVASISTMFRICYNSKMFIKNHGLYSQHFIFFITYKWAQ